MKEALERCLEVLVALQDGLSNHVLHRTMVRAIEDAQAALAAQPAVSDEVVPEVAKVEEPAPVEEAQEQVELEPEPVEAPHPATHSERKDKEKHKAKRHSK